MNPERKRLTKQIIAGQQSKMLVTAKFGLAIEQNGNTLHIAKGDTFNLYGRIFSCNGVIVDITNYPNAFDIVYEQQPIGIPIYEVVETFSAKAYDGDTVVFKKGMRFNTVGDTVYVHGCTLDLATLSYAIQQIGVLTPEQKEPSFLATIDGYALSMSKYVAYVGQKLTLDVNADYKSYAEEHGIQLNVQLNDAEPIQPDLPYSIKMGDKKLTIIVSATKAKDILHVDKGDLADIDFYMVDKAGSDEQITTYSSKQDTDDHLYINSTWLESSAKPIVNAEMDYVHVFVDGVDETERLFNTDKGEIAIDTKTAGTYIYSIAYIDKATSVIILDATCEVTIAAVEPEPQGE